MARARLRCISLLLLYSQTCHGQPALLNTQNIGVNNINGFHQQSQQRTPRNFNSIQNGAVNVNLLQPSNLQQVNTQSTAVKANIDHLQQQLNLPPNIQCQTSATPQNNFQITKMEFVPVVPGIESNFVASSQQPQTFGVPANFQMNISPSQMANSPATVGNLADLAALKGQPLLSLLSSQNNCPEPPNQIVLNSQNQLTDAQKQDLVKFLQQPNQQGLNVMENQARLENVGGQQPIIYRAVPQPQQAQAVVTPLGTQPAYITVQAQPVNSYLQSQIPPVISEEPPISSFILSELDPQNAINYSYTSPKKESDLKALIPLIINILKEKRNCCRNNCGCTNHNQSNDNTINTTPESRMAQILEGYSNQRNYSQNLEDIAVTSNKINDDQTKISEKPGDSVIKQVGHIDIPVASVEGDSEYEDDEDEDEG